MAILCIHPEYNRKTKSHDVAVYHVDSICGLAPKTWYFNSVDQAIGRLVRFPEIMPNPRMRVAVLNKLSMIR